MSKKSLIIYSVSLITPIIVWFVLFLLAKNSSNSYDPTPWIQNFVENPMQRITQDSSELSWIHIQAVHGELVVKKGSEETIPLKQFSPSSKYLILLVEAQGPTLAGQLFEFLKEHSLLERSLTLAVSDGFLKDVRFYNSEVALGAGQAYLVRFRAMQTLWLEKFLLINMSGVWLRPEIFKESTTHLTDTFVGLHVPVFIGPVSAEEALHLPTNANYLILDSVNK
jgi:hypothetical protein